ncbi:MAG: SIS domain-containing protein [Alphaproteobacteria bacterium]|nr:SIS domain-containing protein [Alphaproteobacteria bacterium]
MAPTGVGQTLMAREIDEIPEAAARLAAPEAQAHLITEAELLRGLDPACLMTLARGSSDHAASYLAYAFEYLFGRPVATVHPSIRSVYGRGFDVAGGVCLAISQSGKSADLLETATALGAGGARVLALTNVTGSPLEAAASVRIDTCAGPERAVAATKSVTNSVLAGLWLAAHWREDAGLIVALADAAETLANTVSFPGLDAFLAEEGPVIVLARGPGLGVAQEIALKLQETCGQFAQAYSAAEFLHGPSAAARPGQRVLMLDTSPGLDQARDRLRDLDARVFDIAVPGATVHPLIDPLLLLPPLYHSVEAAARARGLSPDHPFHLTKETITR